MHIVCEGWLMHVVCEGWWVPQEGPAAAGLAGWCRETAALQGIHPWRGAAHPAADGGAQGRTPPPSLSSRHPPPTPLLAWLSVAICLPVQRSVMPSFYPVQRSVVPSFHPAILPPGPAFCCAILPPCPAFCRTILPPCPAFCHAVLPPCPAFCCTSLPPCPAFCRAILPPCLAFCHAVLPPCPAFCHAIFPPCPVFCHAVLPPCPVFCHAVLPPCPAFCRANLPPCSVFCHAILPPILFSVSLSFVAYYGSVYSLCVFGLWYCPSSVSELANKQALVMSVWFVKSFVLEWGEEDFFVQSLVLFMALKSCSSVL